MKSSITRRTYHSAGYFLLALGLIAGMLTAGWSDPVFAQARVTRGLQALYDFEEGSGTNVTDTSGVGTPLDLGVENGSYSWGSDTDGGYLDFIAANRASNGADSNKIYQACTASTEISVEAWIRPANNTQGGAARIVTLSLDGTNRNFQLMQNAAHYEFRLRTTNNGTNELDSPDVIDASPALQHVVYTYDGSAAQFYIDGAPVTGSGATNPSGDFTNWNAGYDFGIGNEFSAGSSDTTRDWQGEFYLVAVYCVALTGTEVQQNYSAGPLTAPPVDQIRGMAYYDADYDGSNGGEMGLANVAVSAYRVSDGQFVDSDTTAANGAYALDVPDGTAVRIEFTNPPAGYQPSQVVLTATSPDTGIDAGFFLGSGVCGGGGEVYQLDWGAIGWVDPPDDGSYPWIQTFTDVGGSGVDMTVTIPRQHRSGNTQYIEDLTGDEVDVYTGDPQVLRFWHPDDSSNPAGEQIDLITVSFSEQVLVDDLVFGGNRLGGSTYGALEVKVYDGPDLTGSVVLPRSSIHPDPSGVDTVDRGTPVSQPANAALTITDDNGTPQLDADYIAARQTYATVGLTSQRHWAIVDYNDMAIQSVSWEQYGSSSSDAATARDNLQSGQSNSSYLGGFFFQTIEKCDYGDLPDATVGNSYATQEADDGARHRTDGTVFLGMVPDHDDDGQPTTAADGDDTDADGDDEDGVTFLTPLVPGENAVIRVTAGSAGYLSAFIDFDGDGDLDEVTLVSATSGGAGTPPPAGTLGDTYLDAADTYDLTIAVPSNAVAGETYSRFRYTAAANHGGNSAAGGAITGEVEDYGLSISATDWGDAPAGFGTLRPNDGPRHIIGDSLYLGACVDGESDGQADGQSGVGASGGDDNSAGSPVVGTCTGGDDEDGVTLVTPLIPGAQACIEVDAVNTTGGPATLQGWIDFDGDGGFLGDADEALVLTMGGIVPDNGVSDAAYCFDVPAGATFDGGETHMRFRLSSGGGLDYDGLADDGEVEDYYQQFACVGNYVWMDSDNEGDQDEVGTRIPNVVINLVWYGFDNVTGGSGAGADIIYADTTDANGQYHFCGLLPQDGSGNGGTYQLQIPNPPFPLTSPIDNTADDQDNDGQQPGGPGTLVFTHDVVVPASFNLPTGEAGLSDSTPPPGAFPDDQVDQTVDIGFDPSDLGDLPDTDGGANTFPTTINDGGEGLPAAHGISGDLYLGACVGAELDGQPTGDATGDDANADFYYRGTCAVPGDDEDGVTLVTPLLAGEQACVQVDAVNSGAAATLYGWIDFDGDGDFVGDPDEALSFTSGGTVPSGGVAGQLACFDVPAGATFDGGETHMRFRLSTDSGLSYNGAASDGEVEDYYVQLACVGNYVWHDVDEEGDQEVGEPGIPGVTVELWQDGGSAALTSTTTDGSGLYRFCGLTGGDYYVVVPAGNFAQGQPLEDLSANATGEADPDGDSSDGDDNGVQSGGPGTETVSPVFAVAPGAEPEADAGDAGGAVYGYPDNQVEFTVDLGFHGDPTAVTLARFEAETVDGAILLTWETVSELDTLGFHLYRAQHGAGPRTRLTAELIVAQAPGGMGSAIYTFRDDTAASGTTYYYWLEAVDVQGHGELYGPVEARLSAPGGEYRIFLPLVNR